MKVSIFRPTPGADGDSHNAWTELRGADHFAIVFAFAFGVGALRVTFAAPAMGAIWSTLLELPVMLAASWWVCAWMSRVCHISQRIEAIVMSLVAFTLLMGAELAGSVLLLDRTIYEHVGTYATAAGLLGMAGQVAFGLFPIVRVAWKNRANPAVKRTAVLE
jgi:hypothetical protein